ncbi:MAG: Asp-tRNA(Asn)/Glu-tRNA(Gln) amidotransferase subunit GatA [Chlorobi bacterium]|nr:Asp-tRNA(Asn)/Glu-tRNA(Gln) amidotransferase subunit GatA [Chlorobiota bacterium]MCI0716811.1 Asp-tRNA(Asn)/Glu-tRNA(Gln) amidotransferase subunit GatA [Chlorobiota bacterium]
MYNDYAVLRSDLNSGKLTAVDVVKYYLANIEKGKHLNAFLSVFKEEAKETASEVDKKIKNCTAGRLAGMVVAVKDVLSLKNKTLTCGSKILENFEALYTATAVQRLIDEDAIIIGKTNCDEFAMGSSNENSAYGAVKNPYDHTRVPGGSSGGSAVAVAADMCMVSLGTDTGGSVRQPAALCGVVGFKPTYGRVSRFGLTAFASSFDTIGPFAKNVQDIALVLEVMAGWDEKDSTCVKKEVENYSSAIGSINENEMTIGIVSDLPSEGLQKEIKDTTDKVIGFLKSNGYQIKPVELPHAKYSIQTYYILTTAEASSNLARYDGARYGHRSKDSKTTEDMNVNSRTEGFGPEVKRRIMLGTYVLSAGYYDAYYKKAQRVRRLIKQDFENAFKEVDLIIMPTTPTTAFKIGEKIDDPLSMYLNDIFTTSSNLSGNPSISIPVGMDNSGLPIGLQIIGRDFDEIGVLKLANYIMRNC